MKEDTKFKIKCFILYLLIEPWSSKVSIPNLRSISWTLIFISILFNNKIFTIILLTLGLILYLINEYQTGRYIHWYRMKKYKNKTKDLNTDVTQV